MVQVCRLTSFCIINLFYKYSEPKINIDNTQAVWLGKKRDTERLQTAHHWNWVNEFVLLGIILHVKQDKMFQLNYDKT